MARQPVPTIPSGRLNVELLAITRAVVVLLALARAPVEAIGNERMALRASSTTRLILPTVEAPSGTPPAPVNTAPPVVSGLVRIGEMLSTTDGTWTDATTFAYQWTRDGAPIGGATGSTHTAVGADISALIACEVTATGPGGVSAPVASNDLASPWQPILSLLPGLIIWDGNDPYCYGGAAIGAPVVNLYSVDGILIGTQATTAQQGTRAANYLNFDGVDDYYDLTSTMIALHVSATTYVLHVSALTGSTNEMFSYVWRTAGGVRSARVAASTSTSRNDHRTTTGPLLVGVHAATQDIVVRLDALNNAIYTLVGGVTLHVAETLSTPTGGVFDFARLGADNNGNADWRGRMEGYALHNSAWDTTTMGIYRACAIAAGVM